MSAPCWLNPSFRHCVVGNSLQPAVAPPPAPSTPPTNAFALIGQQLDLLSKWSVPDGLKRAAFLASAAFTEPQKSGHHIATTSAKLQR